MNKIRKIIPVILLSIFSIIFGAVTTPAFAEEIIPVNSIDDLKSQPGSYRLEADIALDSAITLRGEESGYTLDLNGHNIITSTAGYFRIRDNVTIKSSTGTGTILGNYEKYAIQVGGYATPTGGETYQYYGNLTLESGNIIASTATLYAIRTLEGSTTTINGGNIAGLQNSDSASTILVDAGATLTINGGNIGAVRRALFYFVDIIINDGYVYSKDDRAISVMGDSTLTMNGGTIKTDSDSQAVNLSAPGAVFTMNDGEIIATIPVGENSRGGTAIVGFKGSEFIMNGGRIETTSAAVMGNGSISGDNEGTDAKFTINDGTIVSDVMAIYAPQPNGVTTISGGTLIGSETAVEIRAGTLNISGGTFIGGDSYDVSTNYSGTTTRGAAVAISQHNTRLPISVNICGGTFRAAVPFSEANPLGNERQYLDLIEGHIDSSCGETKFESTGDTVIVSEDLEKFVYGGLFSHDVEEFIADGYGEVVLVDGFYEVNPIRRARLVYFRNGNASLSADTTIVGESVTVNATPDEGYELAGIVVSDSDGDPVQGSGDSYTAPDDDTFVWVMFRAASAPEPEPESEPEPEPEPQPEPQPEPEPEPQPEPQPEPEPTPAPEPDNKQTEPDQPSDTPRTNDSLSENVVLFAICLAALVVIAVYRHRAKKVSL